jgi:hypothetical protein
MDIFTYHAAAETLFGKLQQRKGSRQNKEEVERKDRKIQKGRQDKNKSSIYSQQLLLRLAVVNYSEEREQDRTKKEVERKDRKIQKGRQDKNKSSIYSQITTEKGSKTYPRKR